MEQPSLIEQGLELMIYGMGTVFVFLALLVAATTVLSRVLGRYLPEAIPTPAPRRKAPRAAPNQDQERTVAVISAAIHAHRSRHKR